MTELLEMALDKVKTLPAAMQDDAARMLLLYAGSREVIALSQGELRDLVEADEEIARGETVGDAEFLALLATYRE